MINYIIRAALHISETVQTLSQSARSVTFQEATDDIIRYKREIRQAKEVTIRISQYYYRNIIKKFPHLANKKICDITKNDLIDTIGDPTTSPAAERFGQLRTLFNHSIKMGWITSNPIHEIPIPHPAEREKFALTPTQISALFLACRPPTAVEKSNKKKYTRKRAEIGNAMDLSYCIAPLALMTFGGIRPEEIRRLTWDDINFDDGVVEVSARNSKTGGTRHVSISPVMREWLEVSPLKTGPLCHPTQWVYHWATIRSRAGWNKTHPWKEDTLRHTFATYHAKTYKNFSLLQMEMGHAGTTLLRTRYINMRGITSAMAEEFWQLTPESVKQHP